MISSTESDPYINSVIEVTEKTMETVKCIRERRSIRKFKDEPVPRELIEKIVETAAYAPSWKNKQPARYLVVEDREKMNRIADGCVLGFEYNINTIRKAPALVLVNIVKNRSGYEKDGSATTSKGHDWEVFDAGIATQTFCLAAHDMGLGTVIMGIFDEEKVGQVVQIPEGQQLAALIACGYPDIEPDTPPRKEVSQLLSYDE